MSWLALVAASMGVASCYVRGRERAIIVSFCVTATILQVLDGAPALGAMGLGMVLAGALARARGVALSGLCVVNLLWLLGLPALPVVSTAALLAMATPSSRSRSARLRTTASPPRARGGREFVAGSS